MRRHAVLLSLLSLAWACGGGDADPVGDAGPVDASAARAVIPGVGLDPLVVGQRYAQVRAALGEPSSTTAFNRIVLATWDDDRLELMFASPDRSDLTDDAQLLSIGLIGPPPQPTTGPRPGLDRAAIEAELGEPPEEIGAIAYYPDGLSVRYDGDRADAVAIFAAYQIRLQPPPMLSAGEQP